MKEIMLYNREKFKCVKKNLQKTKTFHLKINVYISSSIMLNIVAKRCLGTLGKGEW